MKKRDVVWIIIAAIVGIVLYNLSLPTSTTVTQTVDGQPIAGQGVDLYGSSELTVEGLAAAGGLL
jgi:hypothetical protein